MNRVHRIQAFNVDRHDWSLKANCHHPDAGPKGMQPSVGGPHALGKHERTVSALEQLSGYCPLVFPEGMRSTDGDRKSTRLNSSHGYISYAVFCLTKKSRRSCGRATPS